MSFGIKVSKPGIDVNQAADADLLFNTDEEMMKVYETGSFDISGAADTTIMTHNLGYVPMFIVFAEDSDGDVSLVTTGSSQYVKMNNYNLILETGDLKGYYIVYYNSLETELDIPVSNKAESVNIDLKDSSYGVVSSKENKDISDNLDDIGFSSNLLYNKIHKVSTIEKSSTGSETLTFSHDVDGIPLALVYGKIQINTRYQLIYDASDSILDITEDAVTLLISYEGTYSAVIFKDIYE